jgi:hypothetical protein
MSVGPNLTCYFTDVNDFFAKKLKKSMFPFRHNVFTPSHTPHTSRNFFFIGATAPVGLGLPPWNSPFLFGLLDLRHSVGLLGRVIRPSQGLFLYTHTQKNARAHTNTHTQTPNMHVLSGIQTHDHGFRANEDSACHRVHSHCDRQQKNIGECKKSDIWWWLNEQNYVVRNYEGMAYRTFMLLLFSLTQKDDQYCWR